MELRIRPRQLRRWLTIGIAAFVVAHLATLTIRDVFGLGYVMGFVPQFQMGLEGNAPTWFSSILLLTCAALLAVIALMHRRQNDRYQRHWLGLAIVFAFLSCDEVAQVHEQLVGPMARIVQIDFFKYIAWVLVYFPLVAGGAVVYLAFLRSLPKVYRRRFIVAATLYVGGAVGMELITGLYGYLIPNRPYHWIFVLAEEVLEMSGAAYFAMTLARYLPETFPHARLSFVADTSPIRAEVE
jgi:uncharacterized membrane protein YhaH (DUF805 family)